MPTSNAQRPTFNFQRGLFPSLNLLSVAPPLHAKNRKSPAFARPFKLRSKTPSRTVGGHSCPPSFLSLRELEAPPRAALPIFLPLLHSRISRQKPRVPKRRFHRRIIFHQRPPQPHDDRPRLAHRPTA